MNFVRWSKVIVSVEKLTENHGAILLKLLIFKKTIQKTEIFDFK